MKEQFQLEMKAVDLDARKQLLLAKICTTEVTSTKGLLRDRKIVKNFMGEQLEKTMECS